MHGDPPSDPNAILLPFSSLMPHGSNNYKTVEAAATDRNQCKYRDDCMSVRYRTACMAVNICVAKSQNIMEIKVARR